MLFIYVLKSESLSGKIYYLLITDFDVMLSKVREPVWVLTQWKNARICSSNANERFNHFTEEEDATDADEMTTFDGSTISLSLSPIMTPAKQGDEQFNMQ